MTPFACLLHINAAENVAFLHLMRQLWLLPDVLHFSLSYYVRLTLLPTFAWMGSSLWRGHFLGPYLRVRGGIPPRMSSKNNQAQQDWARSHLGPYSLLGHGLASCGSPGPLLVWEFNPYNSPSKFRLLLSYSRRKDGILTLIEFIYCGSLLHSCGSVLLTCLIYDGDG